MSTGGTAGGRPRAARLRIHLADRSAEARMKSVAPGSIEPACHVIRALEVPDAASLDRQNTRASANQ